MALLHGEEAAEDLPRQVAEHQKRKQKTVERQAEAKAISRARVARGEGEELDADRPKGRPQRRPQRRPLKQRVENRRGEGRRKQTERKASAVQGTVQQRYERTHARELAQAEAMAIKALQSHGMHHHFRPIAKVAFFCARMATSDRNGNLARQILGSINMPSERIDQVLTAAHTPEGYTPKRDTSRGKREHQERSEYDGRSFGRRAVGDRVVDLPGWKDGQRLDSHPGAIRVIAAAVFAWLSKVNTRRKGYAHSIRGFGRGVWRAACGGCGIDALFGHTDGMPGAMVALKNAGFFEYGQPPAEAVSVYDRGPSGHAYNVFWMRGTVAELQMDALRERLLDAQPIEQLAALIADPAAIEGRASGPPGAELASFSENDIPF